MRKISYFSSPLANKVYFRSCTCKGNAISKKDFKTIRENNIILYKCISSQKCRGFCYSICFDILQVLKKGCMQYVAAKKISVDKEDDDDGRNFTMHVLYINNGWAFDTYSQRPFPTEELHKIIEAKVYKSFSFEQISGKSFEDFKAEISDDLVEWANNNDCSIFD